MESVFGAVAAMAAASWDILLESAPWVLLGFLMAGLLKALLPPGFVARHLGRGRVGPVVKAAVFGVPLPLCSCGVVPAAAGLREQGASKGATASFLIATPETGVDSMAITYALLDPLMTLLRPLSAFVTAVLAGFGVDAWGADKNKAPAPPQVAPVQPEQAAPADAGGCGCSAGGCCGSETSPAPGPREPAGVRVKKGLSYAFGELLGDIGGWLLIGVLVAGAIAAWVPDGVLEAHLGGGIAPMLLMLVVGVPLYVCATASTPIAAALALKGLSPGAALVFLLAGPATNVASLLVVQRLLGRRATVVYLAAIAVSSLGLGLAANALYGALGLDVGAWVEGGASELPEPLAVASAVLLLLLIGRHFVRARLAARRTADA
jgi:hypothetical protein